MRRSAMTLTLAVVIALCVGQPALASRSGLRDSAPRSALSYLKIVFAALDRAPDLTVGGLQQIYTVNGDGSGLRRITSPDGYFYDWPVWAFNGSKIVYTARKGETPGVEEAIWMMDPDGSNRVKLTSNPWRNAQPKVSSDGRSIVFASIWNEAPELAIYRMDLATLEVQNLTAQGGGTFAFESDPNYSTDGRAVVFAYSGGRNKETKTFPTQIWTMNADGTRARAITDDLYYNTDPSLSPDGRSVAISSYRGEGTPRHAWPPRSAGDIFLQDWQLVVRDIATGNERTLTKGARCINFLSPCASDAGSAWVPKWTPDGLHLGYLTVRSPLDTGIDVIDADGTNAYPLIEVPGRAINWWDWTDGRETAPKNAVAAIGSAVSTAKLLFSASVYDQLSDEEPEPAAELFSASSDRWVTTKITPATEGLVPGKARWTPDRSHIVFTSRVKVDRSSFAPTPAPPPGEERRVHFTFAELESVAQTLEAPRASGDVAEEQVFIMAADGSDVRRLTTPWTEDYLDAISSGDARGNTDPDVSPDGRYVVFTNLSTLTQESFILRLDLQTGDVVNLTNVTVGAVPVADANPRYSPDGSRITFNSSSAGGSQIYVMRADGSDVRALTNDDYANVAPNWSPDGKSVLYSSYRGHLAIDELEDPGAARVLPKKDWFAVTLDVETGNAKAIAGGERVVLRPIWSPDGGHVAFISVGATGQPDIYVVGSDGRDLRPMQASIRSKEAFIDWR